MLRPLLPLALLCWLLSAQLAACTRDTFMTNRALLARPVVTPLATPVNLTRQQFVQATWALQDVTCAGVFTTAKDKNFNNTLAKAVEQDFKDALVAAGWPGAAAVVRAVRQPCKDITYNGRTYASFRVGVRFNSTNTTQVRDEMWNGVGSPGIAKPCSGGYNTIQYKNVAALFAKHKFTVSQNNGTRTNMFFPGGQMWVEYAAPCVPKPKPIIKAPVVNVPITSTSCDPAAVQALADSVKGQVTAGMDPAQAALVYVEVVDCLAAGTNSRRLLQGSNITVILSITITPLVETPAQVEAATRALYTAITGEPSATLPAGASLDTVLQLLNKKLEEGDAQQLLEDVQKAIVQSNLTSIFDASLTNATQIAGGAQAIRCPNLPDIPGAAWSPKCLNQIPGFECIAACTNGGTLTATCSEAGTWTTEEGAACPAAPQPVVPCSDVPSTTPEGAAWPNAGCTNQTQCTATCSGDTTGSPYAVCDTTNGAWSTPAGSCTPIRCLGVPLTSVANANWATDCGTTVGSTCTASCVSSGTQTTATCTRVEGTTTANWVITSTGSCAAGFPTNAKCSDTNGDAPGQPVIVCSGDSVPKSASSDIPIAGLEAAAAEAACCDKVYPATATCANSWTTCPSGSTPNPDGQINGLVVGSADAQKICCSSGALEESPSPSPPPTPSPSPSPPPPCNPTCTNTTAGIGSACGSSSDGCGGTCTTSCSSIGSGAPVACQDGVCTCQPLCTGGAYNQPEGYYCAVLGNGCGGICAWTCGSGLKCNTATSLCECEPQCSGTTTVDLGAACGPISDTCGGTCQRQCTSGTFCNTNKVCQCTPQCTEDPAVPVGGFCGQVPDQCGSTCTKACTSASDCVATKCEAKVICQPTLGLTGLGTTIFHQEFETDSESMYGGITRVGPDATKAFQGKYYAYVPAAGSSWKATTWGTPYPNTAAEARQRPTQFPATGKLVTQIAVYLDPEDTAYNNGDKNGYGQRFHYTVSFMKKGTPAVFNREYIFSIGWYTAATAGVTGHAGPAFWISGSHNTGWPRDPNRNPVPIIQKGWYYLQHVFYSKACSKNQANASEQCLYADMSIFKASQGTGACNELYSIDVGATTKTAVWQLGNNADDFTADMGGAGSASFIFESTDQADILIDSASYRSF